MLNSISPRLTTNQTTLTGGRPAAPGQQDVFTPSIFKSVSGDKYLRQMAQLIRVPEAGNDAYPNGSIASRCDFTVLEENKPYTAEEQAANRAKVVEVVRDAERFHGAAACIRSQWIPMAKEILGAASPLKIATVVGFPDKKGDAIGVAPTAQKVAETRAAVAAGADEIDMVLDVPALQRGDNAAVQKDIKAVVDAADGKAVKVIFETGLLTDDQIRAACKASESAGAAYVKTSTGYGPRGASFHDAELMRDACSIGIKLSGGVRTLADCKKYVEIIGPGRPIRFGTSAGSKIAAEEAEELKARQPHDEAQLDKEMLTPKGVEAVNTVHGLLDMFTQKIDSAHQKGIPVVYLSVCVRPNDVAGSQENIKVRDEMVGKAKAAGVEYVDPFEIEGHGFLKDTGISDTLKQELLMDPQGGLWPNVLRRCDAIAHGDNWKYSVGAREEDIFARQWGIPDWDGQSKPSIRTADAY